MKKERKRGSLYTALMWRLGIVVMALWLAVMGLITVRKALEIQNRWHWYLDEMEDEIYQLSNGTGYWEQRLRMEYDFENNRPEGCDQVGMVFLANDQVVNFKRNYASMGYWTEESWLHLTEDSYEDGDTVMDLDAFLGEGNDLLWQLRSEGVLREDIARVTGYFHNGEFVPTALAVWSAPHDNFIPWEIIAQLDRQGEVEWRTLHRTEATDKTLVNLYTYGIYYHYTGTSEAYHDFSAWKESNEQEPLGVVEPLSEFQLMIRNRYWNSYSLTETFLARKHTNIRYDGTSIGIQVGLAGNPLKAAMIELWWVYLLTILIPFGLLFLHQLWLERRIQRPLEQVVFNMEDHVAPIPFPCEVKFDELHRLQRGYVKTQQEVQTLRQENQRLTTALEYAENAEISRRQMVSNITHELKTPLAVIHSYAEGLMAGIAPEKQQKYLSVITEEADRMDAMVLEMLDLSRLEAGKVRLAQDQVELLSLTKGIMEKLQPIMEVKGLRLNYAVASQCPLVADEGRLSQVITNLASNAIKYSPEGGMVTVNLFQRYGITHFTIENQSKPLSEEALEKVFDSFYRTEQSRTTKGTGLGLSICKAIIEHHRGQCHARNTETGVEFGFDIP